MAWHRPGDKPLSEPMVLQLLMLICITRPWWVKYLVSLMSLRYDLYSTFRSVKLWEISCYKILDFVWYCYMQLDISNIGIPIPVLIQRMTSLYQIRPLTPQEGSTATYIIGFIWPETSTLIPEGFTLDNLHATLLGILKASMNYIISSRKC